MKKFSLLFLVASHFLMAQPFEIGRTTMSLFDSSRNRTIATEVFYPADANGINVPFTAATTTSFPLLSFGHGFVMTFDAYQNFWEELVPQGFIIAFPKTEGSIVPSHTNFAKDLAFVIEAMNLQNTQPNSLFFNRVSSKNAVMGHSMGGGCALLSKQYSDQINHIVTFAAAETNPSAIVASSTITLPSLTLAGKNDCITPPTTNQLLMHNASNSSCKNYIEITGASHCQMANSNFFCNVGEASCSPTAAISREAQHEIVFSYLNLWLDYYLNENCISGELFEVLKSNDETNELFANCILCAPLVNDEVAIMQNIFLGPNPFLDKIVVTSKKDILESVELFDGFGKKIKSYTNLLVVQINTLDLADGLYFVRISQHDATAIFKIIKN